jgi:hypothetical protein
VQVLGAWKQEAGSNPTSLTLFVWDGTDAMRKAGVAGQTHIDSGYWLHQQARDLHSRAVHQEDMDLSAGVAVDDVPVLGSATPVFVLAEAVPRFGTHLHAAHVAVPPSRPVIDRS